MASIDYEGFKSWLASSDRLSARAITDTVSRLKRADSIVALRDYVDIGPYLEVLIGEQNWIVIAEVSRPGIIRASRMYFLYRNMQKSNSVSDIG